MSILEDFLTWAWSWSWFWKALWIRDLFYKYIFIDKTNY